MRKDRVLLPERLGAFCKRALLCTEALGWGLCWVLSYKCVQGIAGKLKGCPGYLELSISKHEQPGNKGVRGCGSLFKAGMARELGANLAGEKTLETQGRAAVDIRRARGLQRVVTIGSCPKGMWMESREKSNREVFSVSAVLPPPKKYRVNTGPVRSKKLQSAGNFLKFIFNKQSVLLVASTSPSCARTGWICCCI